MNETAPPLDSAAARVLTDRAAAAILRDTSLALSAQANLSYQGATALLLA